MSYTLEDVLDPEVDFAERRMVELDTVPAIEANIWSEVVDTIRSEYVDIYEVVDSKVDDSDDSLTSKKVQYAGDIEALIVALHVLYNRNDDMENIVRAMLTRLVVELESMGVLE